MKQTAKFTISQKLGLLAGVFLAIAAIPHAQAYQEQPISAETASEPVVAIETAVTIETEAVKTMYLQVDYRENARQLLQRNNSPLAPYTDVFFDNAKKPEDAALAIAIAGAESSFGKYPAAAKHYNAWGYFCERPNKTSKLD